MNASITAGPPVSLQVWCSDNQQGRLIEQEVYRPGDIISAWTEVRNHQPFEGLSLHASLIGETRIWTHPADRTDVFQTMVYTHLNQFQGLSHRVPLINSTCTGSAVTLPVTFVLPELVTGNKDINGRMPPSCGVGSAYIDPWGKPYMQPLIEYYLQITLRYRLPTDMRVRIVSTKRKIKITTSTHDDPPTYLQHSTKVQPVAMFADIRRSRFSKPFARLSLSMTEPLPVVRNPISGSCQSTGLLHMTWSTSSTAYDEFELGRHPVRINYRLKARTRFSTRPIHPGSDCGKPTNCSGKPQKRVEITHLATFEVRPTERDHVLLMTSEGWERSHTGTIPLPICVLEGTIPTFSHLLASRDYTLLLNVSIQGLRHAALSLEVPLQICETLATCKLASTQVGSLPFADMLIAEELPKYEDHRPRSEPQNQHPQ